MRLDADDDLPAGPALVFLVFSCVMKGATLEKTGDDGGSERTNDATAMHTPPKLPNSSTIATSDDIIFTNLDLHNVQLKLAQKIIF